MVFAVLNEEVLDTLSRQRLERPGTDLSCASRHRVNEGACGRNPNRDRPCLKAASLREPLGELSQRGLIRCRMLLSIVRSMYMCSEAGDQTTLSVCIFTMMTSFQGVRRLCAVQDRQPRFLSGLRPPTPHN